MAHWRISLFFVLVSLVLAAASAHVHRRTVRTFALPRWTAYALGAVLLSGIGSAFAARASADTMPQLARLLGGFGGVVTIGVLLSSALLVPYELTTGIRRFLRRVHAFRQQDDARDAAPHRDEEPVPPAPEAPARREFLAQGLVGGAVVFGMGASGYGALFGRTDYTLETIPIHLGKLPRALDGFSIVQLSDLHVGLYVGEPELRRALDLVKAARPDIVVLTGDLIDHDPRHAPVLGRFVRRLRDYAPRGVFAVPGNHDYYAGVDAVLASLRGAGAEVLVNRHVLLGDRHAAFALGGLDDVRGPRFGTAGPRPQLAFAGAPTDLARVLLSHNPAYFPQSHAWADLTLSGHTHGGQITLFVNPAELVLDHGFVRGHYAHAESQLYVNRGFGTAGPPARVGSPPEVTKLVLTTTG